MIGWEDRFKNLSAACGGKINPETLIVFEAAMAEYAVFMRELRRMFGPTDAERDGEGC